MLNPVAPPAEPGIPTVKGSAIEAAATAVGGKTVEQAGAINALGGKMTGGAEVEVKRIPVVPSAGSVDPTKVYAGMME